MVVPSYQELLDDNQRLRQQLAEQQRTLQQLQQTVRDLQQRLADAERAAKRQAAPFSKGPPKDDPKRPGRKAGARHGRHNHRPVPPPERVDEVLEAPLPEQCPDCGIGLVETHTDHQYQTEIPRQPHVRQFNIHCGHCPHCHKPYRGRHPLQTSDATGAAQSQLGPDAQAAVVYLNKDAGLSHGKVAKVFGHLYGITLTRGASAQIVLRGAQRLRPTYQEIRQTIQASAHLTPDETGWRVGGHPVWLHAWVGDQGATCYVINPQRSAAVLEAVIGSDWSGTMTHDGFASYDRFQEAVHQQCVDHALRRAQALAEKQSGRARDFPNQVSALFTGALQVRDDYREGTLDAVALETAHTEYVSRLLDLTDHPRQNAANNTFAKHLYGHGEQWLMFLIDPDTPATNHRAEQALKTPIVNRKVWGGNRTEAGARAQEVTSSVLQTCKHLTVDVFSYLSDAFRGVVGNLFGTHTESQLT